MPKIVRPLLFTLVLICVASGQSWEITKSGAEGQRCYSTQDIWLKGDALHLEAPVGRYGILSHTRMIIPVDKITKIRSIPSLTPFVTIISFAGGWYSGLTYGRQYGERVASGDWFGPNRWALWGSTVGGGLAGSMAKKIMTTTYDLTGLTPEQKLDSIQTIIAIHYRVHAYTLVNPILQQI